MLKRKEEKVDEGARRVPVDHGSAARFEDGFSLSSLLGTLFVALVMVPGALYMELVAGLGVGNAAQWVTVILFVEVAKRANAKLSRAQLFILFYMSGILVGQRVNGTPLFRQFVVRSDAAVSFGISSLIPAWVAPSNLDELPRTFLQRAWLPVIGLMLFPGFSASSTTWCWATDSSA